MYNIVTCKIDESTLAHANLWLSFVVFNKTLVWPRLIGNPVAGAHTQAFTAVDVDVCFSVIHFIQTLHIVYTHSEFD